MLKFLVLLLLASCGPTAYDRKVVLSSSKEDTQTQIKKLKEAILALQGGQAQIDALVNSDFATCPTTGETANQLINTMCRVAQYSTNEAKVQLKGELASYSKLLSGQIDAVNETLATAIETEEADIEALNISLDTVDASITAINTSITTLQGQMTTTNTAIAALQAQVNGAIIATNGAMTTVDIGIENLSAGPIYESILRSTDKTKINAYVEASTTITLGSNPLTTTSNSSILRITATAHGLSIGDSVYLTKLVGSRGLTNEDVFGLFIVSSIVDVNNITVIVARNAKTSGAIGGSIGVMQKITGRGLATVWNTADGADTEVRVATSGTREYNFIVKADGFVCYDRTDHAATYVTIIASGLNITCK